MIMESSLTGAEMLKMIATTGYTDIPSQLRASFLLGEASRKFWTEAKNEIKKKHFKEMQDRVAKLQKWGTAVPSEANVRSEISKVLQENGIYPYPNLVQAFFENGFQDYATLPDRQEDRQVSVDK